MKPAQKTGQELPRGSAPEFNSSEVFEAIRLAGREAVARHKALGQSVVVWQDGKVVILAPEDIPD